MEKESVKYYKDAELKERIIHHAGSQKIVFLEEQGKECNLAFALNGGIYIQPLCFQHVWSDKKIIELIAHEKAHLLVDSTCSDGDAHGETWRLKCIELGGTGAPMLTVPLKTDPPFITALAMTDGSDEKQANAITELIAKGHDPNDLLMEYMQLIIENKEVV
jgi:hypothetical protein